MTNEEKLVNQIEQANAAYWRNDPIIDDFEYDRLVEELRKINPNHPLVHVIGDDAIVGDKIRHVKPMLSLDKVYSWSDLVDWCKKVSRDENELFRFSPKFDGLSLEIANGRLVTRGNGTVGTDITHLAPWISLKISNTAKTDIMASSFLKSNYWKTHTLVGELLVPFPKFDKLKNSYPEFADYKTPRNLASGFANIKKGNELLDRLNYGGVNIVIATWVFHRSKEIELPLKSISCAETTIVKKLRNFHKFPTDGIVCRLSDDKYAESLGVTQHHPRGSVAFKFKDDEYTSIVRNIVWQVGNEAVTPVAEFDPVEVDGVEVRRATCHNAKFVADNNIHPGSEVTIVRRGGVIPKIVKVRNDPSFLVECRLPTVCPSCNATLVYEEPDMLCVNQTCPGRCTNKIVNGLAELSIKGIGPSMVERLVRELHIVTIMDFFMEAWDQKILMSKGFTAHEIKVLMSEIDRVVTVGQDDESIFASLCIPQASRHFASQVIKYLGGIISLVDYEPEELRKKLNAIPGMNSTSANNVVDFLIEDESGLFESYYNLFNHKKPIDIESRTKYCFTGALPYPRKDLEQWVLDAGGYPTDNIRQANYLVSASPLSTSTKMRYAREHNIPVITFEQLMNQLSK